MSARSFKMVSVALLMTWSFVGAIAAQKKVVVAAMGDSITVAFSSDIAFKPDPAFSWSTGEKSAPGFESHLQRLRRRFPNTMIQGKNVAVSGATIDDIAKQVVQVNALRADYVTLLVGGNDVCGWASSYTASETKFLNKLNQYLSSLTLTNPNIRIVLSAIPDITQIWDVAKNEAACQKVWTAIPRFCSPIFGQKASDSSRIALRERLRQTNFKIADVAKRYAKNVKFAASVGRAALTRADLSPYDCFHPSVKGQSILSAYTWNDGWFPDER